MATSLGLEDQALTDLICRRGKGIDFFTLDTGRLFVETCDLIEPTEARYQIRIRVLFPDARDVEELVNRDGVNCFLSSVDLRKACCRVRKVLPLQRALQVKDAWICGLRREQSAARQALESVEWDQANGLVKINPLASWTHVQWAYVRENRVPYSRLHDEGYPSIGCACCTRPVWPGDDPRSGRWWWEVEGKKECGLHRHPGHCQGSGI